VKGLSLRAQDLTVGFGREPDRALVVDRVSFSISPGQTLALVGESGSGKSITALSILRLLPSGARLYGGKALLEDRDLFQLTEQQMRAVRGGRVGMIFQEPMTSLNPVLTVGQQIVEGMRQHASLSRRDSRLRTIELLEQVGIEDPERRFNSYPHQLSGGMQQRAMIAGVLACRPGLLIADEPTTALDVTVQAQVLELLQRLRKETGMSMLFITHDLALVNEIADEIAVMRSGVIVESAPRKKFFHNPSHDYSKLLFNVLPGIDKRGQRLGVSKTAVASVPLAAGARQPGTLLSVRDLKVHFPIQQGILKRTVGHVKAVDGVSLDLQQGETLAIVGESGSGKTTLARSILQLIPPTAGSVKFCELELTTLRGTELRNFRAQAQIVFQDPYSSMNPRKLISEIIQEGMQAQKVGADAAARQKRVLELLDLVGLPSNSHQRYPHEFSGGQRQRIAIARALALNPRLLVCDEPTSALDVSVQAQILDLLQDLQAGLGLSYLFITHNIAIVAYMAHRVAVMHRGKIVETGDAVEVLRHPAEGYTRSLLAAIPKMVRVA
jgi:ABC-type microcin C transport system duplicated ATPase subunit YejF